MSEQAGTIFDATEVVEKDVNENGQVYLGRHLGGGRVKLAYKPIDDYECDECGGDYTIREVIIRNDGERVVCADCAGVEDRII